MVLKRWPGVSWAFTLGYAVSYGFLGAVSWVVAAIAEMLPALVTAVLALCGVVMAATLSVTTRGPHNRLRVSARSVRCT